MEEQLLFKAAEHLEAREARELFLPIWGKVPSFYEI